jgi:hypothetical protein
MKMAIKKISVKCSRFAKSRIYAGKRTKRGFSKKALARIDFFFRFL